MADSTSNNTLLDLPGITRRARLMLKETRKDGTEFAQIVGVPYSTMRAYLSGNRAPSPEFLAGIYRAFRINPVWLLTGDGPIQVDGVVSASPHRHVEIPLLQASATSTAGDAQAAGVPSANESHATYETRPGSLSLSRDFLTRHLLDSEAVSAVEVRGSAATLQLSNSDQVVIDRNDTQPRSGFVYVIRQGDELLVKHCQRLPGGLLRVSNANQTDTPYDIDLAHSTDVTVVGRVVASLHEW